MTVARYFTRRCTSTKFVNNSFAALGYIDLIDPRDDDPAASRGDEGEK